MPILELDHVGFSYPNGFCAVKDVCLSVEPGEKIAIIGENGAGKTTTAKLINGLLRPSQGEVRIYGKSTAKQTVASIASQAGYVFQNPDDQIFNKDIYSEITYTLRYNKVCPPDEIERRAADSLELVGLADKSGENPYDLSYSHRKFVTICSVILQDPALVILDEPTAGQDLACLKRIGEIVDYLQGKGKAVITITHDMEFVANHFDRVVVMAHGNIIADGTPREIFWNADVLKEAALHPPYIGLLARELGLDGRVLSIDEFIEALERSGVKPTREGGCVCP